MTLFIKIRQFNNFASDGYVFIEGSRAGSLITQHIKSGSHKPNKPFTIMCANDDRLTLKLCKDERGYEKNEVIGVGELNVPILLHRNKHGLNMDSDFISKLYVIRQWMLISMEKTTVWQEYLIVISPTIRLAIIKENLLRPGDKPNNEQLLKKLHCIKESVQPRIYSVFQTRPVKDSKPSSYKVYTKIKFEDEMIVLWHKVNKIYSHL